MQEASQTPNIYTNHTRTWSWNSTVCSLSWTHTNTMQGDPVQLWRCGILLAGFSFHICRFWSDHQDHTGNTTPGETKSIINYSKTREVMQTAIQANSMASTSNDLPPDLIKHCSWRMKHVQIEAIELSTAAWQCRTQGLLEQVSSQGCSSLIHAKLI